MDVGDGLCLGGDAEEMLAQRTTHSQTCTQQTEKNQQAKNGKVAEVWNALGRRLEPLEIGGGVCTRSKYGGSPTGRGVCGGSGVH